jgi:hypothetical protein
VRALPVPGGYRYRDVGCCCVKWEANLFVRWRAVRGVEWAQSRFHGLKTEVNKCAKVMYGSRVGSGFVSDGSRVADGSIGRSYQ